MECRQQLLGVTQTLPGSRARQGIPVFQCPRGTSNEILKPLRKPLQKKQNSEGGDVSCSIWIYWCFLGPFFGGGVGLGRQEKVKFYIILFFWSCLVISPPKQSHLDRSGGNNMDLHLDTPQCPRIMVIPHVEMERDRQQESACGFYHYWRRFYHYWGFFLYL